MGFIMTLSCLHMMHLSRSLLMILSSLLLALSFLIFFFKLKYNYIIPAGAFLPPSPPPHNPSQIHDLIF